MIVILSALVSGFLIWKRLVISRTTGNKRPTDGKGIIRPANSERLVEAKGSTYAEGLVDAKEPANGKRLADGKEPIVIYYKQ